MRRKLALYLGMRENLGKETKWERPFPSSIS
jgi:hypothetical protein